MIRRSVFTALVRPEVIALSTALTVACSSNSAPTGGGAGTGATGGISASGGVAGTTAAGGSAGMSMDAGGTTGMLMKVTRTDLSADQDGRAAFMDPNLLNGWGLAINPNAAGGPLFWVSANHAGVSTVYDAAGAFKLAVTIPGAGATATGSPTGQIFNASTSFMGDKFVFDSEDGLITGWQAGTTAVVRADNSAAGAIYKGLALVDDDGPLSLWAANFHAGTIDVFDANYAPVAPEGRFVDPALPAGFAPFNAAQFLTRVYVAYAAQDANAEDDVSGPGLGRVDVFKTDGTFDKTLVTGGALNSPWGLARAPQGFGAFSGALLVGNFGDGTVHAYDVDTGAWLGQLADPDGNPLVIDGLWAIAFVPSTVTQGSNPALYFTAGPAGETHGVFGKLEVAQ